MANQIDKDNIVDRFSFSEEGSSYAFVKKEIQSDDNFSTDIFSVYGSDGTLLAAFDSKEAAIAAIMQSGLRYISLH
ncbi:MAG: DUF1150 family protein [Pelagibacteraceae bacterium TMED124]|nr:hypothetical protein [Rickettsiales bacterium]RPG16526.1 MAG: DUF1150 family protein [Pelagibacteraceae bacterium TMED124]|tara:strand:+ start:396 stop:623 length:228 start_codon:yes stop_codon:yes gene_type:complete